MTMYAPNQLHSVPLAELQPDPAQPRKYLDPLALEELTASISQLGIIEPIVCRQDKIRNLDLLSFAQTDREMVMEAMSSLKNSLNEAFDRAAQ